MSKLAALKQVNEMASVERKLAKALLAQMLVLKNNAIKYQMDFRPRETDFKKLNDTILSGLITAHLLGKRRARIALKNVGVKLDIVAQVNQLFKGATADEIQQLANRYAPSTQRVLANLTTKLSTGMREALAEAVNSQVTVKAAIESFFTKAGFTSDSPWFIETLLRTQTQIAYGAARYAEYQNPEIDEILWGYEYVTVGDDRVRENHAVLDGVKLPKEDRFWQNFFPPNGYNCRCQAVPIFEKERIKRPPENATTDEGFDFNPAQLLNVIR